MRVEEFDITRTAAKLRNEALAARFGVPEARRLVAPALFTAAGALVRDEIGLDRLRVLLAAAAAADDGLWFRGTEPAAAAETAAQAIQERAHRIRWWVVAAAGFADGINPCAFATLIFFVSYLQVMRRRPREIAAIGIAFIAGLFLTYLLLGFGLLRVLESLQLVRWLGLAFNWALAGALAVLVILSGRDAVRAFRGQLADMTLQLPEFLKRQTRDVIRGGARQRWFALAAFVTGATVAVLELACTGQVYLPTLQYMLEQGGGDQGRAVTGIFLYNVAFIIPLVVVFALVTGGMTSARLAQLLQRHGGFAKLALAAVFLFFFLFQTWLLLRH